MKHIKKSPGTILLEYDDSYKCMYVKYLKASSSEEFRSVWNRALEIAIEKQCRRWLLDQRKQSVHPKDQDWIIQEWYPQSLQKLPFSPETPSHVAVVESENFFIKYTSEKFIKEVGAPGLTTATFRSEKEAREWLMEVHVPA